MLEGSSYHEQTRARVVVPSNLLCIDHIFSTDTEHDVLKEEATKNRAPIPSACLLLLEYLTMMVGLLLRIGLALCNYDGIDI